jgi:hypothetical protein
MLLLACGDTPVAASALGPDCAAFVAAARRATQCDPTLANLATRVEDEPDEQACRSAARRLLAPQQPAEPRVRSVFEAPPGVPGDAPLTASERAKLDALPMPAFVVITPDVAPAPGVASTVALIGELQLRADAEGRLRTGLAAGARSLRLEHAGQSAEYCVELKPCETLTATAHGAKLARHPDIRPGPC